VSLSTNGGYLAVGADTDASNVGAVNVYISSGPGTWTLQTTTKLTGTGGSGSPTFGSAIAISGDSTTLVVGAPKDTLNNGRFYIYIRSGTIWTQQQAISGTGTELLGSSAAISQNGSIIVVGAPQSSSNLGITCIYNGNGITWSNYACITGTGSTGTTPKQGTSIAMNPSATTIISCGVTDNTAIGACWIFTYIGSTVNFSNEKLTRQKTNVSS